MQSDLLFLTFRAPHFQKRKKKYFSYKTLSYGLSSHYLWQYPLMIDRRGWTERDRSCVSFRCLSTPLSFLQLFPTIILRFEARSDYSTGLAENSWKWWRNSCTGACVHLTEFSTPLPFLQLFLKIIFCFEARFENSTGLSENSWLCWQEGVDWAWQELRQL